MLKESADLVILGVTFDAKMTFEKHHRSVSSAAAQRLGMRKSWQVFHDWSLLLRSFFSFVLPVLEYCSAVWCSAADSHLKLLDRVLRSSVFLAGDGFQNCFSCYNTENHQCYRMGYIVIFKRLAGIPCVALLVRPMVQ